jgi:phosphoglycolate phosphatase-like HAD superfamily hydrolase
MGHSDGDHSDAGGGVRHVVWDWNGTLFDDHVTVVAAVNDALALVGLPPIDSHTYRSYYTRPVQRFYEQVAGRPLSRASGARSTTPTTTATSPGWSGSG